MTTILKTVIISVRFQSLTLFIMNMNEKDFNISILADIYGAFLTERQLEIIRDYYDFDSSLAELSEKYGIARQSAKDSINSAKKTLIDFEQKLKLAEKFKEINELADKLLKSGLDNQKTEIIRKIKSCID